MFALSFSRATQREHQYAAVQSNRGAFEQGRTDGVASAARHDGFIPRVVFQLLHTLSHRLLQRELPVDLVLQCRDLGLQLTHLGRPGAPLQSTQLLGQSRFLLQPHARSARNERCVVALAPACTNGVRRRCGIVAADGQTAGYGVHSKHVHKERTRPLIASGCPQLPSSNGHAGSLY